MFLKKKIDNAQSADIIQATIEHLIKSEGGTGPMISQQPAGMYSVVLNPAETRDEASNPVFNPCRFPAGVVFLPNSE